MINRLRDNVRKIFTRVENLPAGMHHFQSPPDSTSPYRLHLRLEPDGSGILIINASTVLHLNQTAAEFAYQLIKGATPEQAASEVESRYQVSYEQALADYKSLSERVQVLANTNDLDPVTYLDFERRDPYSTSLSAPYRLDCAVTYRLPGTEDPNSAPLDRVKSDLSTANWKTILQKAWDVGIPQVVFTGGEPTLREDLVELITYTQDIGQVSGLLTNGYRLSDPAYLGQLLQAGLDHIMFLLEPNDEASWRALQSVLAADIFVTVHLTITPENVSQIDGWLERLAGMGVCSLSLSATDLTLADTLQHAQRRAAELLMTLVWDLPVPYSHLHPVALEKDESVPDGAGNAWLYVEPDGDVLPTQGVIRVLGNMLSDPWEKIWSAR